MITQAACKVMIPDNDDEYHVIPLHRHGDIGRIFKEFGYQPGECKIIEQGFIDNKGNFYNRKAAAEYMKARGQRTRLGNLPMEELFSEDLY